MIRISFQRIKSLFLSEFFKSSLIVGFSKLVSSFSNLIFMIYSVNLLARNENGYLQYYLGYLPVILAIAEFGLPTALIKYLSVELENLTEIGNLLNASLLIKFFTFLVLALLGICAVKIYKQDGLIIFILILGGTLTSFLSFFESVFVSFREYRILAFWIPLGNLFRLLILSISDLYFPKPLGYLDILLIYCISPIFVLFLFFFIFPNKKITWSGKKEQVWKKLKLLSSFNMWAFVASIFAILSDRLEIFLLKKYHSPEQVAIYGTSLQLLSGFQILFSTLNSILLPKLSSFVNDNTAFHEFLKKSFYICIGLAGILAPGFFLTEFILDLLFNHKYSDSIPVFKIHYPNFLLQLIFAPLGIALFAMGKPKMLALLAFLRLVFGFIFDTLLIPNMGAVGAGFAFLLGQIVSWLILIGYFLAVFWK